METENLFGMENLPDFHLLFSKLYKAHCRISTNIAELAAGRQCFIYVSYLKNVRKQSICLNRTKLNPFSAGKCILKMCTLCCVGYGYIRLWQKQKHKQSPV